ncbi:MAG TPA: VOC family protein [Acidobacteriaceae bacterium]|jgi:catechol 2,3-dioxygenase-like lactoylglutathione lyase family enzyme|nr:VOC family protein [Acidobacteriaceae bacterium]
MRQTAVSAVLLVFLSVAAFAQTPARPRITGVSHIAVYTSNAAAAEHYYVHDIGLKKGPDPEDPAGVRYYVNSTQFIEVMPLPANAGNARLDHIGYITTDAEALRLYLADHRYAVPDRVHRAADGSRWFSVKDPEGNKVQFVQPAPNALSMTGADPIGRHVIHVGERVKSADAENAFYRDLLGFKPYWFGGMKPGKTDWISQQVPDGHDWLEYMMESGDGDISQRQFGVLDHLSIGVVNMEQAVTTLDREGRLNNPHTPMQIGRDGKWQYNLFDPDGTRLELMEFTPVEKPCCSPFTAPNPSPDEN